MIPYVGVPLLSNVYDSTSPSRVDRQAGTRDADSEDFDASCEQLYYTVWPWPDT